MSQSFTLAEDMINVQLLAPAADAAGRTSSYFSLKYFQKAFIVVSITQGNAATILLSPLQASAVAGTGSKAVPVLPIWSNLDTTVAGITARTAAATYTTDAAVKNKVVIFQIDPAVLDQANGFDCIAVSTGASNAANITSAMLIGTPRYPGPTQPSVLID
jgi:hypothetical protein